MHLNMFVEFNRDMIRYDDTCVVYMQVKKKLSLSTANAHTMSRIIIMQLCYNTVVSMVYYAICENVSKEKEEDIKIIFTHIFVHVPFRPYKYRFRICQRRSVRKSFAFR